MPSNRPIVVRSNDQPSIAGDVDMPCYAWNTVRVRPDIAPELIEQTQSDHSAPSTKRCVPGTIATLLANSLGSSFIGAPFTAGVLEFDQFVMLSPGACVIGAFSESSAGGSILIPRSASAKR